MSVPRYFLSSIATKKAHWSFPVLLGVGLTLLITYLGWLGTESRSQSQTLTRIDRSSSTSTEVRCGDPISKKAADAFVAQATRDFPNLNYFVDVQSKPVDWNRARWVGGAAALGAGLFDAHTTTELIAAGGFERNPIYGSHPTAARLYGTNIGVVVGAWILTDWLRHRLPGSERALDRNMFFSELGATALHVGAGVYNETVINRQRTLQQK